MTPEAPRQTSVLVVDDDQHIRSYLRTLLTINHCAVEEAADGEKAVQLLQRGNYDVVLTDLMLPVGDGLQVLREARARPEPPEVLIITAFGTIDSAVEAVHAGAFDYLTKPLASEKLLITLERALERRGLRREVSALRREVLGQRGQDVIIAASPAMRQLLQLVDVICRTDSSVVIEGESGTGKEVIARAIHYRGRRASGPFVAVNCAAIPGDLLESELFGHTRGAFTGAITERKGLFEAADRGTLLLDEIGDMPLALQSKLLRVLQSGELRRLGSTTTLTLNVRVVAATNRDILGLVRQGKFREDLYYRLNVIPMRVPPLRERTEDIIPLVNHFLARYSHRLGKEIRGVEPGALQKIVSHPWPGNIRELENAIERAITLCSGTIISASDFAFAVPAASALTQDDVPHPVSDPVPAPETLSLDREKILRTLLENDWNQTRAAQALGIGRNTLWRKMKRYSLVRTP